MGKKKSLMVSDPVVQKPLKCKIDSTSKVNPQKNLPLIKFLTFIVIWIGKKILEVQKNTNLKSPKKIDSF
jgi:hypothetical protein